MRQQAREREREREREKVRRRWCWCWCWCWCRCRCRCRCCVHAGAGVRCSCRFCCSCRSCRSCKPAQFTYKFYSFCTDPLFFATLNLKQHPHFFIISFCRSLFSFCVILQIIICFGFKIFYLPQYNLVRGVSRIESRKESNQY